jgi:hypothetical protein
MKMNMTFIFICDGGPEWSRRVTNRADRPGARVYRLGCGDWPDLGSA